MEVLHLVHTAWCLWRRVRKYVYYRLGVSNTEELIKRIIDVSTCRPDERRLEEFLNVLREVVERRVSSSVIKIEEVFKSGVDVVPFFSRSYPCELLKYRSLGNVIYPPLILYVRNLVDMNSKPLIAVVGTRECSKWGREVAFRIGELVAKKSYTLVTGLAEGIDASATEGALKVGGWVIGVRPWLSPLSLPNEARKILEYSPSRISVVAETYSKPKVRSKSDVAYLYYLRNRIIAGMSKVVVVVEARNKPHSGSMHQIELALKRGKPVIIMEHPERGGTYWEAYRRYVSKGAIPAKDPEEVVGIIDEYLSSSQ